MNIRELAAHARLSKGAVSLALRDHASISAATRRRVKALAKKFAYIPDPTLAKVMSAVSRRRTANITAPLGIISLWPQPRVWQEHASLRRFYQGLVTRARELGYRTEEFWMGGGAMLPQRVEQILLARGIEGLLVLNYPRAPAVLEMNVEPFACAVIGRALIRPRLFSTDHDHHQGLFQVIDQLHAAGYHRPGFILQHEVNERTMHCWAAAYQFWSSSLPRGMQMPILYVNSMDVGPGQKTDVAQIKKWFRRHRPDAILSHGIGMKRLIEAADIRVPRDAGFASLFWIGAQEGCAGLDLQDEVVSGRAVELVLEQLRHNQRGVPSASETVLFPGIWRPGPSLPLRVRGKAKAVVGTGPS